MKGQIAKEKVANIIKTAFTNDYIGEFDRKHYVWADDGNGQRVQIAITLTCPKVLRGIEETSPTALNFDDDDENFATEATTFKPAEISQEEQDTLAELMSKLGL